MITRIALYAALGSLLDALGQGWTTIGSWCVLALFLANETLTRLETINQIQKELNMMRKKIQQGAQNDTNSNSEK